jgi:hypothetical protein
VLGIVLPGMRDRHDVAGRGNLHVPQNADGASLYGSRKLSRCHDYWRSFNVPLSAKPIDARRRTATRQPARPRPRDGSVVSSLHCMNDPQPEVRWQATSSDESS